jgi:hypothetical protein
MMSVVAIGVLRAPTGRERELEDHTAGKVKLAELLPEFDQKVLDRAMENTSNRITTDPAICLGKPCIRGLRIRVKDILDLLSEFFGGCPAAA